MPERQTESKSRFDSPGFFGGWLAGIAVGSLATASILSGALLEDQQLPQTTETEEPAESGRCAKTDIQDIESVPSARLALSPEDLASYTDQIQQSTSFAQTTKIMNEVFGRWDYTVFTGEVPTQEDKDIATRGQSIEHTPDELTQDLVNISSIHILESLSAIPEPLLEATRGTKLYLTMTIVGESGWYGGLYGRDANGDPYMIVGIGPNDPSGEIFEHEFAHRLFYSICGDAVGYNDTELAALNPDGFTYTKLPGVGQDRWFDVTASEYGATNTAEDIAEAFPLLLRRPLADTCGFATIEGEAPTIVCEKLRLLTERVAAVSPEAAAYLTKLR